MTTNPLNIVYLLNSQLFFICLNIDVSCLKLQMKAKTVESLLSCFEFDLTTEDSGSPNSIIGPQTRLNWRTVWGVNWDLDSVSSSSCCPVLVGREVRLRTNYERALMGETQSTYLSVSRTQRNSENRNKVGPIITEIIQRKDEARPLKEHRAAKPVSPLSYLCPEG